MSLTPRHLDVLRGLLNGKTDLEIAQGLGLAMNTVKRHNQCIYEYLGICGRIGLVPLMAMVGSFQSPRFDVSFDVPEDGNQDQGMWVVVPKPDGPFLSQGEAQEECNVKNKAIGWKGGWVEEEEVYD